MAKETINEAAEQAVDAFDNSALDESLDTALGDEVDTSTDDTEDKFEVSDEDFTSSQTALIRDGWDRKDIEALAKENPERFRDIGLRRAKAQTDIDAKFKEHQSTAQQLAEMKRSIGGSKDDGGTHSAPDKQFDLTALLAPLSESLKDLVIDEDGIDDAIARPFRAIVDHVEKYLGEHDAKVSKLLERLDAMDSKSSRDELVGEFPQLKETEKFELVRQRMKVLEAVQTFSSRTELMRLAAQMEFASEMLREAKEAKASVSKKRDNGTPSLTKRAGSSSSGSRDETVDAMLDAQMAGDRATFEKLKRQLS